MLCAFFDQIDIGLAVTFPDGRFARVNGALCAMLGYQASALLQHGLTDLIIPDQRRRLAAVMAQFQVGEKQRFQIKPELLRRDGRTVSGLLTLSVVSDRVGRIRHLLVSFQEGRDRVQTHTELTARARRYQALADGTFEAVCLSENGICIDANLAAAQMFGISRDAVIGMRCTDAIAPELRSMVSAKIRSGDGKPYRAVALRPDGSRFHVLIQGKMIRVNGNVQRVSVIRDIDDQVAAETTLKERTDSLSEVNTALEVLLREREADRLEMKEKMLANAKSLILPYLEKLKSSRLDMRQRTYLNLIESNLNEIISPLTQRMSGHYMNFTPMEIQVANLVKEGQRTKDIAVILGLSVRTIEAVRYRIRMKLGLKRKGTNLRSTLLSMDGGQPVAVQRDSP